MKLLNVTITMRFTTDAALTALFTDSYGNLHKMEVLSWKSSSDNYFNSRMSMNQTPCTHVFTAKVPDDWRFEVDESYVEFGYLDRRYNTICWNAGSPIRRDQLSDLSID